VFAGLVQGTGDIPGGAIKDLNGNAKLNMKQSLGWQSADVARIAFLKKRAVTSTRTCPNIPVN
jgi:hypothetical protein